MKKPYRFHVEASTYPAIAEQHDNGSWTVETPFEVRTISNELFIELYTPMSVENYETQPGGEPFKLDIDKALEEKTHTVALLKDSESIDHNHAEFPEAWYLTASRAAYRFSDFPVSYRGTHWEGQPLQWEEDWATPLIALNPTT